MPRPRSPQTALLRLRGPARVEEWLSAEDVATLRQAVAEGDVDTFHAYGSALGVYGALLSPPDRRHELSLDAVLDEAARRRRSAARDAYAQAAGWTRAEAEAAFVAVSDDSDDLKRR